MFVTERNPVIFIVVSKREAVINCWLVNRDSVSLTVI